MLNNINKNYNNNNKKQDKKYIWWINGSGADVRRRRQPIVEPGKYWKYSEKSRNIGDIT